MTMQIEIFTICYKCIIMYIAYIIFFIIINYFMIFIMIRIAKWT